MKITSKYDGEINMEQAIKLLRGPMVDSSGMVTFTMTFNTVDGDRITFNGEEWDYFLDLALKGLKND